MIAHPRRRGQGLFAERQINITLTRRRQIALWSGAAAALGALALGLGAAIVSQQSADADRQRLAARAAQVESEAARVAQFRRQLDGLAGDLARRQAFLEEMVELLPQDVVEGEQGDAPAPAAADATTLGAALPEAAALSRIERRQLALADRLTRFADRRAAGAEAAIRQLGLDPRAVLTGARAGQGGPLERLSVGGKGSPGDARFRQLGTSLARMDELERALGRIPQVMPASIAAISSGFGLRRDPFTGEAAMHSGLDFRGGTGAPIHSAASGRVSFVGVRGGYGKVVEISHGNGLMTRYAHMSGFRARPGQEVAAGEVVGLIGSTGRSTGPHLHFEVRVNGRAVNPRPFLMDAPHLLEQARHTDAG